MRDHSFRADIQGLRGLAVLAVVLYHSNLPIHGGFLGVDVFFVISGFVVTLQITRHLERDGKFSLVDFYSRRIRRLVPIYLFVVAITIPFTVIFLSPFGEQQEAFSTARWSGFFVSNYQLMLDDSYQNLVANPFRHLWSLSVEEQFYLVLPMLFVGSLWLRRRSSPGNRIFRNAPQILVTVISIASLVHALLITQRPSSVAAERWAFFSMPTRMWELGAGVILAMIDHRWFERRKVLGGLLGLTGISALVVCFVLTKNVDHHPGWAALAAVASTVALLMAGQSVGWVKTMLSFKPLKFLGDVSYGWYLWHWPFIVFAALIAPDNKLALVVAAVLALSISVITYRFIENPIRKKEGLKGGQALALVLGSVAMIFVLSFVGDRVARTGLGLGAVEQSEFDFTKEFELDQRGQNMDGSCFLTGLPEKLGDPPFGDLRIIERDCSNDLDRRSTDVLLIGDSTALAASDGILEAGRAAGVRVVAFTAAGCPTFVDAPVHTEEGCLAVQDTFRKLVRDLRPKVVVLVNRFDLYVGPILETGENDFRIRIEGGPPPARSEQNLRNVMESLANFVDEVSAKDRQVVVMVQPPPGFVLDRTLFERWFPGVASLGGSRLADVVHQRDDIRQSLLETFADAPNVVVYDPGDRVCGRPDFCPVKPGEGSTYANSTHLNPLGSLRLMDDFVEIIRRAESSTP